MSIGKIIWFSPEDKIGYVAKEGSRMIFTSPAMYFFNEAAFPGLAQAPNKDLVGQLVKFDTMFSSTLDEDVVKTMELL